MKIAITPVSSFNGPATHIELVDTQVVLGSGLNTEWRLLNAAGEIVSARSRCALTDKQYNAWTGADEFVCQSIAVNLGLKPA